MLEIMKTIETSFKRSHAGTATLSAPNPVAGHCQPMVTPLVTPRYSQVSLGLFLVGSLFLSPESWCSQVSICALQMFVSPVLCKFWQFYGGLMATSSKRAYALLKSAAPRASPLWKSTADLYLHRRHSNTVLLQSLFGVQVLVCTRFV